MTPQYQNFLLPSFGLFIDHNICALGSGYSLFSGRLYPTYDPNYQGFNKWGSPFRQFVADQSLAGAVIPSGVYNNGNFVPRGMSGLSIDFVRGRVVAPITGFNSGVNFTAAYSIKDFNIYYTSEIDEILLFETAPTLPQQNKLGIQPSGALQYNEEPYPAIFIAQTDGINEGFAFGGTDQTDSNMTCVVLSNDEFKLDAALSIFRDSARKYFPNITGQLPYNYLGDATGFNYNSICAAANQQDLVYINKVNIRKFSQKINKLINPQVFGGIASFELQQIRNPRRYL